MSISSQHHSFDIKLAASYGIQGAILIHHFQHWIRLNSGRGVNLKDGRTWTYQTRRDIQLHFPYMTVEEVKYWAEKLVKDGILMKGNFNKIKIDKTIWYAFVDEKAFGIEPNVSNNSYERGKPLSIEENLCPAEENLLAIPDTKKKILKTHITKEAPKKSPPTADALALSEYLFQKIKEVDPGHKQPNLEKWAVEIDRLISLDGRSAEDIKNTIDWTREDSFWKAICLSADSLRKNYCKIIAKMGSVKESAEKQENMKFIHEMLAKYPEAFRSLRFDSKFATKPGVDSVPLTLPPDTFKRILVKLFGGTIDED